MQQAEEELLILAAQDGSQKAFRMIYQRYQKPLLRYAFKVCNDSAIAQDAAQEAWLKFARNIRKLDDPRAFRSWLYRLVRWCSIDLMRTAQRRAENEQPLEESQDGATEQNDPADNADLRQAIKRLPAVEKQMIHLFYLDELSVNEIANVLEIPSGTVKSRLNRARTLLKQRFDA